MVKKGHAMKKVLCILFIVSLVGLFTACKTATTSQPAQEEQAQRQAPEPAQTAPAVEPSAPEQAPVPAKAKPQPKPAETTAAPEPVAPAAPPVKVKKAGLGILFKGNIENGTFRVKADNDLIYELAFSGKDTDASKEFYLEPGQHVMKFVVIDDKGVRGVREETMNFVSGKHQVVRVSVKDTPGALVVEHLE
jgi:hypothetical protein